MGTQTLWWFYLQSDLVNTNKDSWEMLLGRTFRQEAGVQGETWNSSFPLSGGVLTGLALTNEGPGPCM